MNEQAFDELSVHMQYLWSDWFRQSKLPRSCGYRAGGTPAVSKNFSNTTYYYAMI